MSFPYSNTALLFPYLLCVIIVKYITFLYIIGTMQFNTFLYNCFLSQLKDKRRSKAFILFFLFFFFYNYRITFICGLAPALSLWKARRQATPFSQMCREYPLGGSRALACYCLAMAHCQDTGVEQTQSLVAHCSSGPQFPCLEDEANGCSKLVGLL